jgi:Helix-turn-helix domain
MNDSPTTSEESLAGCGHSPNGCAESQPAKIRSPISWKEYFAAHRRMVEACGEPRRADTREPGYYSLRFVAAQRDPASATPHLARAIALWFRGKPIRYRTEDGEDLPDSYDYSVRQMRAIVDAIDDDDEAASLEIERRRDAREQERLEIERKRLETEKQSCSAITRLAEALAPRPSSMMDTGEVAARLGLTTRRVTQMISSGELPRECIVSGTGKGKVWKFHREEIERWIAADRLGHYPRNRAST